MLDARASTQPGTNIISLLYLGIGPSVLGQFIHFNGHHPFLSSNSVATLPSQCLLLRSGTSTSKVGAANLASVSISRGLICPTSPLVGWDNTHMHGRLVVVLGLGPCRAALPLVAAQSLSPWGKLADLERGHLFNWRPPAASQPPQPADLLLSQGTKPPHPNSLLPLLSFSFHPKHIIPR